MLIAACAYLGEGVKMQTGFRSDRSLEAIGMYPVQRQPIAEEVWSLSGWARIECETLF
jgi:hypothetical protein